MLLAKRTIDILDENVHSTQSNLNQLQDTSKNVMTAISSISEGIMHQSESEMEMSEMANDSLEKLQNTFEISKVVDETSAELEGIVSNNSEQLVDLDGN